MAITVADSAEVTTGNDDTPEITLPGGTPAQGNLLLVFSSCNETNIYSANTGAGWAEVGAELSSTDSSGFFWKIAGASESATLAACTGTDNRIHNQIALSLHPGAGRAWPTSAVHATARNADNDGTKLSTGSVDPTDGADGITVGCAFSNGNDTWSAHTVNGSTTGVVEVHQIATGSAGGGNHITMWYLIDSSLDSGSYTVQATSARSDNGGVWIAVFITEAAAAVFTPRLTLLGVG